MIDILLYICTVLGDWFILASDHDWTLCVDFKLIVLGVRIDSNACSSISFHHRFGQTIAHFEPGMKSCATVAFRSRPALVGFTPLAAAPCSMAVALGLSLSPWLMRSLFANGVFSFARDIIINVFADGHTVLNAPDLFRPPKLSGTGPR